MGRYERQRSWFSSLNALRFGAALFVSTLIACASDDGEPEHDDEHGEHGDHGAELGPASGATCPPDHAALTYEAFGKPFMTKYCTRCHATTLTTPAARMNATPDHDFDVEPGIRAVWEHIDRKAASGPAATNTLMPPASDPGEHPSMTERVQLGQWLACEYGPK